MASPVTTSSVGLVLHQQVSDPTDADSKDI
jgi:hypothetical protein